MQSNIDVKWDNRTPVIIGKIRQGEPDTDEKRRCFHLKGLIFDNERQLAKQNNNLTSRALQCAHFTRICE